MTNPDDPGKDPRTTQSSAPSWVDEVMDASRQERPAAVTPAVSPAGPGDLRIPEPAPRPAPAPPTAPADDWVARATGSQARDPMVPPAPPTAPAPAAPRSEFDSLGDSARQAMQQVSTALNSGDAGQKKVIAGLLGIVLGSLGAHKFYLGMTTPGLIMLGVNLGVWVIALLLGLVTLGVGLIVTLPLAGLVSGAIGLLGLVEGIIYLTKSDADFQREYVLGKKAWL